MKKIISTICGFLLICVFNSCVDIYETIVFFKGGAGHAQQKMDMSAMKEMLNSLSSSEKENTASTGKSVATSWERLKKINGISNVKIVQDTAKEIYIVDFDFVNATVLNEALNIESKTPSVKTLYKADKSTIERNEYDSFGGITQESEDEETAAMMESVLKEMKYHLSITAPGKIKSVSNKKAVISTNTQTVTLETNFEDLVNKTNSLKIDIRYKD